MLARRVNHIGRPAGIQPERGQGMVEFAIILTILVGLFLGIFELMALYRQRTDLDTVTRMAARQAAELHLTPSTDVQAEIEAYVLQEMGVMGYDAGRLTADPAWGVEISSFAYSGSSLDRDTGTDRCQYGDYIAVKISRSWTATLLPLADFYQGPYGGRLEAEYINKCWRGE